MKSRVKLPLSVVIITLNAERTLLQTLLAVQDWVDEIVVVDSGSTDDTVPLAKMLGCRVIHRQFDGYGTQKQFAVDKATHDWVLLLDADEVPDPALQRSIQQVMSGPVRPQQAFSLPRSLVFMGRTMKHSGESRRPVVRLFNRLHGGVSSDTVHERIEVSGKVTPLTGVLLHYSYASLSDYLDKMNRYTTAGALEASRHQHKGPGRTGSIRLSSLSMFGRFTSRFLKIYFLKLGILDGLPGMIWALLSAMYPVVKYTKYIEQEKEDGNNWATTSPAVWNPS